MRGAASAAARDVARGEVNRRVRPGSAPGLRESTRACPVDLHTHSTASDGTLSPVEVVNHASRCGLVGLALTDHDTIAGVPAARQRAAELGLRFLSGVELGTQRPSLPDVHLLAYCVDGPLNRPLLQACEETRKARQERAASIVRQLEAAGAVVSWESVLAEAGEAAVGRPHIARTLVKAGWASDIADAFRRWLVPGAPGYIPKRQPDTLAAIELVRAGGGVPVLAHPGTLKLAEPDLGAFVRELAEAGLAGLECYWLRHDPAAVRCYESLAAKLSLIITGGSDFHGENKPGIEIGRLAEGRTLDGAIFAALEERACSKSR